MARTVIKKRTTTTLVSTLFNLEENKCALKGKEISNVKETTIIDMLGGLGSIHVMQYAT